ncbi:MAG: hypothetical protein ABIA63_11020 [bacterium]
MALSNFLNVYMEYKSKYQFDQTPTTAIIIFEIFIILAAVVSLFILRKYEKNVFIRFLLIAAGVFIFEFFTAPMWHNYKMGWWAYVYHDVSWILTAGWSTLILVVTVFVDRVFEKFPEWKKFLLYIVFLTFLVVILEGLVTKLGIRSYSPETQEVVMGYLPFGAPVNVLYYVPVFMSLVISFYKYWTFAIFNAAVIPVRKQRWLRNLLISFIGVFLFEVMVEPMVTNCMPKWSCVFRDVSLLLTCGWVILVYFATSFIDKFFIQLDLFQKFIGYLVIIFIVCLPLETWLINNGYRIYGPSATAAFSGLKIPFLGTPIEVVFGIPFFFALVIAFIKYWEIILDNDKL